MPRKTVTQKLREEILEAKKELRHANEARIKLEAKLERFEKDEKEHGFNVMRKQENLENQVVWLRNLVEKLAVSHPVQELFVNQNLTLNEMRIKEEEAHRRRM